MSSSGAQEARLGDQCPYCHLPQFQRATNCRGDLRCPYAKPVTVPPPDEAMLQPLIKGYRQLNAGDAELMNEIKEHGAQLERLIVKLRGLSALDQRWVSIGQTDLQQGLMALVRAVARPTSF